MTPEQEAALRDMTARGNVLAVKILCDPEGAEAGLERARLALERFGASVKQAMEAVGRFGAELARQMQPWLRKYHSAFHREAYYRRANKAAARSRRNSPSHWDRMDWHYGMSKSAHNRKRNKHGRTGVAR